ncbi:MAG: lipid-A-disaccharide synthase N-terminal domain-containing protein, partial [Candidatus Brocadiae bacterium]|nr:lipid-A-disaccharide synthase N-terminal domain-containing protein [Candidatus Brocadiia bacterium]
MLPLAVSAAERGQWWPDSWVGRIWVLFGFCAQAAFTARFLIQWIASERRGKSYVPIAFWYLSLLGGAML